MLVTRLNDREVQITLTSDTDANVGMGDEIQTLLRALAERHRTCRTAKSVRGCRPTPSHERAKYDLSIVEALQAALKDEGFEEEPLEDY